MKTNLQDRKSWKDEILTEGFIEKIPFVILAVMVIFGLILSRYGP